MCFYVSLLTDNFNFERFVLQKFFVETTVVLLLISSVPKHNEWSIYLSYYFMQKCKILLKIMLTKKIKKDKTCSKINTVQYLYLNIIFMIVAVVGSYSFWNIGFVG